MMSISGITRSLQWINVDFLVRIVLGQIDARNRICYGQKHINFNLPASFCKNLRLSKSHAVYDIGMFLCYMQILVQLIRYVNTCSSYRYTSLVKTLFTKLSDHSNTKKSNQGPYILTYDIYIAVTSQICIYIKNIHNYCDNGYQLTLGVTLLFRTY